MKKKIYASLLSVGLLVVLSGCGSDDSTTSQTITEPTTTQIQGSPYLNKIGDNGQLLSADATDWDMVELVGEGLLVDNPSYVTSLKTYSYEDAKSYCENLSSGGYSDFRIPTGDELLLLLKVAITSQIEMNYFTNYFKNTSFYGDYYFIWTSKTGPNSSQLALLITSSNNLKSKNVLKESKCKVFCVKTW